MTVELSAELRIAQDAMTSADRAILAAAGVPAIFATFGMIGVARVRLEQGAQIYVPDAEGARAFILAARADSPISPVSLWPEIAPQWGDLVDLVAIHPRHPHRWATRRGAATWLGAIGPQYLSPPPVPVFRSPLSWLRAGATGLCILSRDGDEARNILLRCQRGFVAEDHAHQGELRRLLERPFPIPEITVARPARRRAA